jgi:cephalosporin-C deacetylase-like acetyl esterase
MHLGRRPEEPIDSVLQEFYQKLLACLKRPEVRRTAPYFDPANFAPRIKARALVAMGFIDELCPPTETWAAFNLIRGSKEALPLVDSPHNHLATPAEAAPWWKRSAEWLSALAHDSTP